MDYFDAFLLKKPQGKIIDGKINIGDGWASDCGIYEVCIYMILGVCGLMNITYILCLLYVCSII